jgi:hypothetical protein
LTLSTPYIRPSRVMTNPAREARTGKEKP